ncbi:hypothetical protein [Arthrobacter sp. CAN_C5]|uniref:hypothetical protein n=1 Tax=Arthrobacter sp. CAN_C5 TaxID=2760706 RepID=UPI001AE5060A|nr:hypothetical protein [Arthrobacter sp. CAN_C5]MBP2216324.1 hypothetical protein [Arthrobacter sp. CAN_C5]
MTSRIAFRDLSISDRRLDVSVSTPDAEHHLWFESTDQLAVTTTTMAVALSTLCGRKFDRVEYDFPVSGEVMPAIRELTGADVMASGSATMDDSPRTLSVSIG